jgi:HNH endonuclease
MARQLNASCSSCGKPVYRGRTSRPEITCRECRRQQARPYKERLPCKTCGGPLSPWGKVYCSAQCANLAPRRRSQTRLRACEICGEQYKANRGDQRTCGRKCGIELRRRNGTLATGGRPRKTWPSCRVWMRDCAHCGSVFVGRQPRAKFCSLKCKNHNYRQRCSCQDNRCGCGVGIPHNRKKCDACVARTKAALKRRGKRAREARKRGVKHEAYTLEEIAMRDRYHCGLCRKRVAMTKQVPHPKAPTIDHIVPIDDGGDDVRANVQLAHFICNSRKGTGGTQQLALVG